MRGLAIRLALALNRALTRHGQVLGDRYHVRALGTPREVRRGLVYVLRNLPSWLLVNGCRALVGAGMGSSDWVNVRLFPGASAPALGSNVCGQPTAPFGAR